MVNSQGVAELNSIQNLEESALDQGIISDKESLVGNGRKEIALGAVIKNHIGTIRSIHNANEGNDIGMLAGHMVQSDFPLLVLELAGVSGLVEGLDGIHDLGVDVDSSINNPIGAYSQDPGQF